jgi:hypothetical protein
MFLRALPDFEEALFCLLERILKSIDLTRNRLVGNDAVRNLRNFSQEQMDRPDDDAGRCRHPDHSSIVGSRVRTQAIPRIRPQ